MKNMREKKRKVLHKKGPISSEKVDADQINPYSNFQKIKLLGTITLDWL